ncbi:MAG: thioredoxin family protein [Dokdonia sp.]|jgi:hypothetical protein
MKNSIIKESLVNSMGYSHYSELVKDLVSKGESTGPEQTEQRIEFTKLNASRMRRLDKTIKIPKDAVNTFQRINEKQTWLVILESWCADGAQTIPILNKICDVNPNLDLKVVLRDEYPELMNLFLTNGTRSIPKMIILDSDNNVLNTWGPRSRAATKMVEAYKNQNGGIDASFKKFLQVWYNNDKGEAIIDDLVMLTEQSYFLEQR